MSNADSTASNIERLRELTNLDAAELEALYSASRGGWKRLLKPSCPRKHFRPSTRRGISLKSFMSWAAASALGHRDWGPL